jgi:hypothetical protein
MTDLIQRLRDCANEPWKYALRPIAIEAADALESQATEIAEKNSAIDCSLTTTNYFRTLAEERLDLVKQQAEELSALRADAERLRAAMTLSLTALTGSVDSVRHEVNARHEWYVGVPTRAAQLAGLDRWLADHEAAIDAARSAMQTEVKWAYKSACAPNRAAYNGCMARRHATIKLGVTMKIEARFKYDSFLADLTPAELAGFQAALSKFRKVQDAYIRSEGPNELHPAGYLDLDIKVHPDRLPVSDYVKPPEPAAE